MNHYYRVLGLPPTATQTQIKKAYRKLVMKYHPDRNPNPAARQKFIEVDQAYDYLTSARTRRFYQSKRRYTAPKPEDEPSKSPHNLNEEQLRKSYRKALLTNEYLETYKVIKRNNGFSYTTASMFSLLVLPILGGGIGFFFFESLLSGLGLMLGFPMIGVIWLNKLVYDAIEPKLELLYREYKQQLSKV